jgi:hypothetical protein
MADCAIFFKKFLALILSTNVAGFANKENNGQQHSQYHTGRPEAGFTCSFVHIP